jgi:chromosome segregation ATPase
MKYFNRMEHVVDNCPEAAANRQKPETSAGSVGGPKPKAEPSSAPAKDVGKVDARPVVQPGSAELKQASSLLQKGIEEILVRESELASECAWLHNRVEELTRTLAQAHAEAAREIKDREAAERNQAEQLTGLLTTHDWERGEWQQKLKSSEDSCNQAKAQAGALSRLLQTQQAVTTALKKELAALELQRDHQERALAEVGKEMVAEREARIASEERAGLVEESLQTQWVERQELERQIQAHAASLGSLLAGVTSKGAGSTVQP